MRANGWQKVFKFTFLQNIKNKSFIISTIVISALIVLMLAGINFLPQIFSGDNDIGSIIDDMTGVNDTASDEESAFKHITQIYLLNESGFDTSEFDLSAFSDADVNITPITLSELEGITEKVYGNEIPMEILVRIQDLDYMFGILVSRPADEAFIDKSLCDVVASVFYSALNAAKYNSIGLNDEEIIMVNKGISTNTTIAGEQPKSEFAYLINTFVPMLSSVILFMFIIIYGQLVAQAIATEKTSKVMELLLTSVRPLAIIIGKVLAVGLVSLTQLSVIGAVTGIVFIIIAPFGILGQIIGTVSTASAELQLAASEISNAFSSFDFTIIIWIVVLFILGFLFYALIAGVIGASISRLEDLNVAMQPMMLIGVLGFYLSYVPSAFNAAGDGPNMFTTLSYYLPISSPFSLPSALILGELSIAQILISVLILIASDVLMLFVVAKVYEAIVLHSGDRIKIKDIIKLVKAK